MHSINCAVQTDHIQNYRKKMRKTEGIKILGPKITCHFYADDD